MDDDRLMARTAEGDEEAFGLLVQRWERPVFIFLERMVGGREDALDLSQEVFLRVFAQASRYQSTGRFSSWLFRIAGNLARSHLRRRKILRWLRFDPRLHDRAEPGARADQALEREELKQWIGQALAALPERQREAILMKRYAGMSQQDIATALNTTVPAVESLLLRGMRTLRKKLAEKGVSHEANTKRASG